MGGNVYASAFAWAPPRSSTYRVELTFRHRRLRDRRHYAMGLYGFKSYPEREFASDGRPRGERQELRFCRKTGGRHGLSGRPHTQSLPDGSNGAATSSRRSRAHGRKASPDFRGCPRCAVSASNSPIEAGSRPPMNWAPAVTPWGVWMGVRGVAFVLVSAGGAPEVVPLRCLWIGMTMGHCVGVRSNRPDFRIPAPVSWVPSEGGSVSRHISRIAVAVAGLRRSPPPSHCLPLRPPRAGPAPQPLRCRPGRDPVRQPRTG